jgi:Zn-dependent protease
VNDPRAIVIQIVALVLAIVFHEAAHGWVAWRNGDPTAKALGRITLNPLPHIDLFGSVLLPAILIATHSPILIGWAKPVPVNPRNFRDPKRGFARVSIAGPGSNFLLAAGAAVLLKVWGYFAPGLRFGPEGLHGIQVALPLALFLTYTIFINLVLGVFNMLPIPPLDGGHFLMGVLPAKQAALLARVEPFGMLIVILLAMTGVIGLFVRPISALMALLLR